jgi:hypothetical protein
MGVGRTVAKRMPETPWLTLLVILCGTTCIQTTLSECWTPGVAYSDLCEEGASNANVGTRRRLLWHGGGAVFLDEPDHDLSVGSDYRGDGGTLHDSDLTGIPTLGERACLSIPFE